jgi:thymidylate synthase ThyX
MEYHMAITDLEHITEELPHGGMVLVLNTGALITPEAEAMLQALHSRSVGGIRAHLQTLIERGSAAKFMESFYVGYGHKSIGDCGTVTIFIEDISMLAAKAVQDWALYSGQEASTRYIDFSTQRFVDPVGSPRSKELLEAWRTFYGSQQEPLQKYLKQQFPRQDSEGEKKYEKAIAARTFDILRGFLPAGATTNLAWHTNLRQAADKLMLLRHHPLPEVRAVAEAIERALKKAFPSSFGHKHFETTEEYNAFWMKKDNYLAVQKQADFQVEYDGIDYARLSQYREELARRPYKTELPKFLAECGVLRFSFLLDFGSWRDVQRHRAVVQRNPLVATAHGFSSWYFEALSPAIRNEAQELLSVQEKRLAALELEPTVAQYYTAMGYQLPIRMTGSIPALVYLAELRATSLVHPTLARRAGQIARELERRLGKYGLVLHLEEDIGRFNVARGEHDIVEKEV